MRLSANQLRNTALKACVGAGVARGVAEDIADGCVCLSQMGVEPIGQLCEVLSDYEQDMSVSSWEIIDQTATATNLRVLVDGPSAIDLAQVGIKATFVTDCPLLILGLMVSRMKMNPVRFHVNGMDVISDEVFLDCLNTIESSGCTIELTCLPSNSIPLFRALKLTQPSDDTWMRLQKYADKILVSADEASRSDAGAGDTDND